MKIISTLLALLALVRASSAQQFDIATFAPPDNWKKETTDFAVSFVTTDNATGGWCRITLYKSMDSKGSAWRDFQSEWTSLVGKEYQGAKLPDPKPASQDGWTINSGTSSFKWEAKDAVVLLVTFSGYAREVSILATTNQEVYLDAIGKFIGSVRLTKPVVIQEQAASLAPTAPFKAGIALATTTFDDGWTARPQSDWVEVGRNGTTVRLHYGIEATDELRNSGDLEGHLFDRVILPRFNVQNIRRYKNENYCFNCIYFFEADGTDKATGKSCFLGFRVITNSGVSSCIEIESPSAEAFRQEFPTQEKVESMSGYNKFAITQADLIGTWVASSGSAVNMYSTTTGNYAGMNAVATSDEFTFNPDGSYTSHHNGASGMVGSMQTFDQKYAGKMTVANWELTLTNRFKDKTGIYLAQFEAVRGGVILNLTDKQYQGMKFRLAKTTR